MSKPSNAPIRVLLVEGSNEDALIVCNNLKYAVTAFEVTRAETLLAAQRLMEEHVERTNEVAEEDAHAFDAVLLDLRLPNGKGLACIKALRSISSRIPIIVLTGMEDQPVANYFDAGADDYVSKSSPSRQMESALYRAARQYRRVRRHKKKWQTFSVRLSTLDKMSSLAT